MLMKLLRLSQSFEVKLYSSHCTTIFDIIAQMMVYCRSSNDEGHLCKAGLVKVVSTAFQGLVVLLSSQQSNFG